MSAIPRAMRSTFRRPTPRALARHAFGLVLMTTAVGACGRRPAADNTGLNTDVALAGQLQRQRMPSLLAPPEPVQRPDSFRAVVRPISRPVRSAPGVRTHLITRTVAGAPGRPGASVVGREQRDASAGEVVAAAPAERRSTDAGATTYGSSVSTSSVPASTTDAGAYRPSTNSGAYGAGTYESAGPAPGATDGGYGASEPVYHQPQAHAARDGAFGSVAGAILGAAVGGHNRVRGGLIGAVAGGALGAIYGGSIDRTGSAYGSSGRGTRAVRSY